VSKTEDIEFEIRLALADGPMTLAQLEAGGRFAWVDDRCWLRVAVYKMIREGRIRAVGCDHDSHDGDCVVEAVR
jgi:hypothetical protein